MQLIRIDIVASQLGLDTSKIKEWYNSGRVNGVEQSGKMYLYRLSIWELVKSQNPETPDDVIDTFFELMFPPREGSLCGKGKILNFPRIFED